jgi:predicted dehydrogenase
VGALGRHHARLYAALPGVRLVSVHDVDRERGQAVAVEYGARFAADLTELAEAVDVVSVAVPTLAHAAVTEPLLEAGCDVLVEKPITSTLAEADRLIERARERGRLLQVGHVERFNPALDALRDLGVAPRFAEVHRLGSFSPRSLDIDVVQDLMIHDLDIVLSIDASEVVQVDAVGVPVLTSRVDIANARLRLASGLIANLTASRVSMDRVRKFRIFAPRTYVSMDLASRSAQVYRLREDEGAGPQIDVQSFSAPDEEPLRRQLAAFTTAARERTRPVVSGEDGRRALRFALRIAEAMEATDAAGTPVGEPAGHRLESNGGEA